MCFGSKVTGEKRVLNSELWHACAGPLVSLPPVGSRVVYFPQGHSEQVFVSFLYDLDSNLSFLVTDYLRMFCGFQVAASTNKEVDAHIPNYPSLHPQLICQLHNVTMHVRNSLSAFIRNFSKCLFCLCVN